MVMHTLTRRQMLAASGGAASFGIAGCTTSNDGNYPSDPITQTIPFGAGGGTDTLARTYNQVWESELNGEFTVDNRPGAGGRTGSDYAFDQDPDGYTVHVNDIAISLLGETMYETEYSTAEFVKIGAPGGFYVAWFVEPDSPWDNLEDIAQDLQNGEELVMAHVGLGTTGSLINYEYLVETMGAPWENITNLPVDSGSEAAQAPTTPDADVGVSLVTQSTVEFVNEGDVDVIFEARPDESDLLPDVETFATSSLDSDDFLILPFAPGYMAPPGTDGEPLEMLRETMSEAMEGSEWDEKAEETGTVQLNYDSDEFEKVVDDTIPAVERYAESVDVN